MQVIEGKGNLLYYGTYTSLYLSIMSKSLMIVEPQGLANTAKSTATCAPRIQPIDYVMVEPNYR